MSFKHMVKVPLITAQTVHGFNQTVPGLSTVANIPVIETQEQAIAIGTKIADSHMVKYEYVSRVDSIEDTAEGWTIVFHCAGD